MSQSLRNQYVEKLARIAAELAGRDPDEYITLELAGVTAFDGAVWRYPDFVMRAEAAYDALVRPHLAQSSLLDGYNRSRGAEKDEEEGFG